MKVKMNECIYCLKRTFTYFLKSMLKISKRICEIVSLILLIRLAVTVLSQVSVPGPGSSIVPASHTRYSRSQHVERKRDSNIARGSPTIILNPNTSIENITRHYVRSKIRLHDTSLHFLIVKDYLLSVTKNRMYTILLITKKTDMNDSL